MDLVHQANALRREGRLDQALAVCLEALRETPTDVDAWHLAGRTALDLRRFPLAALYFQAALQRDPQRVETANGLWYAHFQLGNYARAAEACRRSWELDPTDAYVAAMLGHFEYVLGNPEAGRRMHLRALELDPDTRLVSTALLRLLRREEGGWKWFDPGAPALRARSHAERWTPPADRVWRGEAVPGRTVCVYRGGGQGDLILLCRYVPLVARRAGRVLLVCEPLHDRLLASLDGLSGVVRSPAEVDDALYVHLWALPGIFAGSSLRPPDPPYLRPPARGPGLPDSAGVRVGLGWAGNPNTAVNPDRSVPSLRLLDPWFDVPSIQWVSLQVGYRSEEAPTPDILVRPQLNDFGDTARVLSQLDLVITVDTAVANLAGALGVRAWVLPPTYPEFRWGLEGDGTPWYPSVRLFRRRRTDDWEGVIERVAEALRCLTSGHR